MEISGEEIVHILSLIGGDKEGRRRWRVVKGEKELREEEMALAEGGRQEKCLLRNNYGRSAVK